LYFQELPKVLLLHQLAKQEGAWTILPLLPQYVCFIQNVWTPHLSSSTLLCWEGILFLSKWSKFEFHLFIVVLGWGTLWHLQVLQFIKCIILKFTPSTILLPPLFPHSWE
jgi:hypothetical protein